MAARPTATAKAAAVPATATVRLVAMVLALIARKRLGAFRSQRGLTWIFSTSETAATKAAAEPTIALVLLETSSSALVTGDLPYWSITSSSGANGSESDVRKFHLGISVVFFNVSWNTGGCGARTAMATRLLAIGGVSGIQPEHVGIMVIPQRHHEHHTLLEGLVNGSHASLLKEIAPILRKCNPILAECISDSVVFVSVNGVFGMLNGPAILRIDLLHFRQLAAVGVVLSDELGGDGHWLGGVNGEA